ncbi:MAG TPA: hypothetical protein VFK14_00585 [Solirubrobacterales bacterium]|nr:hypothetical protein [Solirubrobacterales bacterium]
MASPDDVFASQEVAKPDDPVSCGVCGKELAGPYDLKVHMWDVHQQTEPSENPRRWPGALIAGALALLAVGGFLTVDWGAMVSGNSARVQQEAETGSGVWAILAPVLAYAAYRVAKRSLRGQGTWLTPRLVLAALVSVIGLLFLAGTLNGFVQGAPDQRVVVIAGREVPIPNDTPRNVFSVTKAAMEQIGFEPWYRNCVIGQAERLLTPAEANALTGPPNPQKEDLALSLALKAQPNCEEPGRELVDASASSFQLSVLKAQEARTIGLVLARENTSRQLQACAENRINDSTDAQILELVNGSNAAREVLVLRLVKPCI